MLNTEEAYVVPNAAWSIDSGKVPISVINFSQEGSMITTSREQGVVELLSSYEGVKKRSFQQEYSNQIIVASSFHPSENNNFIFGTKDGYIFIYDIIKSERLAMTRHLGSFLLDLAVDTFGDSFSIACADGSIRVYDFNTLERKTVLIKSAHKNKVGQSSSIYSILFNPDDNNIILSAVQNDKLLFWDLRTGNFEKSISGLHIKGPSVAMYDGKIITGSFREQRQIEVWDFGTAKKNS